MGKRSVNELEDYLIRLKEREAKLKEELAMQRKAADARATKERNRKIFILAEMIIDKYGEVVLEEPEEFMKKIKDDDSQMNTSEISEGEGLPMW